METSEVMKLGIMQPYFMPYIGYWQLMNVVEKYVVYDDVNYIKGGWINRNRILLNGNVRYFNVPMLGASPNKLINEVEVNSNQQVVNKNLRILEAAYHKAPYYSQVMPILESILWADEKKLSEYIVFSFEKIKTYLDIKTELVISSELNKDVSLRGQDKVIDICRRLGATEYVNAIGGIELYSFEEFKKNNIKLEFLKTKNIEYKQFGNEFESNLSIIDIMMFNSVDEIKKFLDSYDIVDNLV